MEAVNCQVLMDTAQYYPANQPVQPAGCIFQSPSGFAGHFWPELTAGSLTYSCSLTPVNLPLCNCLSQNPQPQFWKFSSSPMCLICLVLHWATLRTVFHSDGSANRRKFLYGLSTAFYYVLIKLHSNVETLVQNCMCHTSQMGSLAKPRARTNSFTI